MHVANASWRILTYRLQLLRLASHMHGTVRDLQPTCRGHRFAVLAEPPSLDVCARVTQQFVPGSMSPLRMRQSAYRAVVATSCILLLLCLSIEAQAQHVSTAPETAETKYVSDNHEAAASEDSPDTASQPSGDFREEDSVGPAPAQEQAGVKGEGQHAAAAPGSSVGKLLKLLAGSAASHQIAEASKLQATRQRMEDSLPVQFIDLEDAAHVPNGDGDVATTGAADIVSHACTATVVKLPSVFFCIRVLLLAPTLNFSKIA